MPQLKSPQLNQRGRINARRLLKDSIKVDDHVVVEFTQPTCHRRAEVGIIEIKPHDFILVATLSVSAPGARHAKNASRSAHSRNLWRLPEPTAPSSDLSPRDASPLHSFRSAREPIGAANCDVSPLAGQRRRSS